MLAAISAESLQYGAPIAPRKLHVLTIASIAAIAAVLVFIVAARGETAVIRLFHASEHELEWISDLVLATFFGVAVFLWLNLRQTRAAISALERAQIVIDAQLSLAAGIQGALLPPTPADENGLRWGARLEPAGRVGGDLYDFVRAGNEWLVLVGDVAGKGVPAALVMSSIRTSFRMMAVETRDPAELTERLSRSLYGDHHGMPYLTGIVLRIDPEAHVLSYVNAGHPAAIVLSDSSSEEVQFLESTSLPAGLFPGQRFEARSLRIEPGSAYVIVTDGITDVVGASGLRWTEAATRLARDIRHPFDAPAICDALIERTRSATFGQDPNDDRTVVTMVFDR